MQRRNLIQSAVAIALLIQCISAYGVDPQYRASVLEFDRDLQQYRVADFNGDGRNDVLVILMPDELDPPQSQDITIFWQKNNGQFDNHPDITIPLKKDILSFSYGDVRKDLGQELVFYSRDGAYSFSPLQESYAGNIQRLVGWPLAQTYRDQFGIRFQDALTDFNNDGLVDLLLAGESAYGVFYQSSNGFSEVKVLPDAEQHNGVGRAQAQLGFTTRQGLTFAANDTQSRSDLTSPTLAPSLPGETQSSSEPLMVWENWHSAAKAYDLDGDQFFEFIYLDDPELEGELQGKRRVNIFNAEKSVAQRVFIPAASVVQFVDWDGDNIKELLLRDHKEAGGATLALYDNHDGQLTPEPVQVMKFSGYDVETEFVDIDADGRNEMLVSYYSLSAVGAVRGGNMLRTLLVYQLEQGEGGLQFERRPSAKLDEKFSSDNFRGLTQRIDISEDVNADGLLDALSVDSDGALIARQVGSDFEVGSEAFWRFVPLHAITWFQTVSINDDVAPDIVLSHQRSITLLVSVNTAGVGNE